MKVLFINAIMYTSESVRIKRADSIKDTMAYDLALAFHECGHDITLFTAEPYKPKVEEEYPFRVVWGKCILTKIFLPNKFPLIPGIKEFLRKNRFDLIVSSEVFSTSTYFAYKSSKENLIAWHELAKHQAMLHQLPSKFWYNIVAKYMMKDIHVVARSAEAREFIKQYCNNTESQTIDHGVNLDKFVANTDREDYFVICSQLIKRKRIDGIIDNFSAFLQTDDNYKLYIIGAGDQEAALKGQTSDLNIQDKVVFTGKLAHSELMPILSKGKAMIVNTEKDNSMISIVESIAVGTPVLTTSVPLNATYIKENDLGIVADNWGVDELKQIASNNDRFVENCLKYRNELSTKKNVEKFIKLLKSQKG